MDRILKIVQTTKKSDNFSIDFDLKNEIEKDFKWETYKRYTEDDLDKMMFKGYKDLLKDKSMKLFLYPGLAVDLKSDTNGSVTLDIKKDPEVQLPRGMKFPKKAFYRILPMLLIPPLIMSAVLPFILPAMKMMIVGVGMLNQMALMGAIFTLMRNNAFSDTYEKKVIYVNDGYKNEKKPPFIHHEGFHHVPFHHEALPSFKRTQYQRPPLHGVKGFSDFSTAGYDDEALDIEDSYSEHQSDKFPPHFHHQNLNLQHYKEEEFEEGERFHDNAFNQHVNINNNYEDDYKTGSFGNNNFKKYG